MRVLLENALGRSFYLMQHGGSERTCCVQVLVYRPKTLGKILEGVVNGGLRSWRIAGI